MAQPPAYNPAHEFVADEAALTTLPGSELDIEFNAIETTLAALRTNIALIQRDDGALANGIVTIDALASDLSALLGDPASLADFQALVDDAEAAATAAAASATTAAGSVTDAATQATNAANSASTASTQATNAANSASSASTQATNAANSALAAAAAAGALAFKFTWSTNNASSDPGAGVVKANTGTLGSIASLYISETDADGNSIGAVLALLDDATNSANGKSLVRLAKNATNWVLAKVTASVTDNGSWDTLTLTVVASAGSFSASDTLYFIPTLHGSDGAGVGDVTAAAGFGTDNVLVLSDGTGKGVQASVINVDDTTGTMYPTTNDSGALGKAAQSWSDLFLASGGVLNWNNGDVTVTHSANLLAFGGAGSGYTFDAAVLPSANDAAALGASATSWADLFLASGGVINFNAGDVTITHSANKLTFAGAVTGAGAYSFDDSILVTNAAPAYIHYASGGASNEKFCRSYMSGSSLVFDLVNDAFASSTAWLTVTRSGQTPSAANFGCALQVNSVAVKTAGKETVWIPAGAMVSRTTNGAATGSVETTTNKVMLKTLDFDTSTQEFAQFQVRMPKSWNVSTVTFTPVWSHASTTTNFGVVWALEAVALSDDDAGDTAFGTAQTSTDTGGTTNDIYIGPESAAITIGATPAAQDYVVFQVKRNVSDGSDTMAIDARLHGVVLNFTTNAATDA